MHGIITLHKLSKNTWLISDNLQTKRYTIPAILRRKYSVIHMRSIVARFARTSPNNVRHVKNKLENGRWYSEWALLSELR